MTDFAGELLERWQVRKNRKQKTAFIERMRQEYPLLHVEESGGCRNLVLGDVDSAEVVFSAHYDTCARMLLPNFLMPRSIVVSLLYGLLIVLPFVALFGFAEILAVIAAVNSGMGEDAALLLGTCIYVALFLLLFILLLMGPANPHTVNDNTSGIITLVELYAAMTDEQRNKAAFVFFDREEVGLLGSAQFKKRHKNAMRRKLLINFDCVSDGDTIALIGGKKLPEKYMERLGALFSEKCGKTFLVESASKMYYPSDQRHFDYGVGVAAFKGKKHLYLDRIHTKRDTVFDEKNICCLVDGMSKLV